MKKKILVVDDEVEIVEMLIDFLKGEGFDAYGAKNGLEALSKIHADNFDAVVCDFKMPKMDGITLLTEVRKEKNYIPFIFLSGNAGDLEEKKMISLGAYRLMAKIDILKVGEVVKQTLAQSSQVKDLINNSSESTKEFFNMLHSIKS